MIHFTVFLILRDCKFIKTIGTGIEHKWHLTIKSASFSIIQIFLETRFVTLSIRVGLTILEI